jgi:hypothetical protein
VRLPELSVTVAFASEDRERPHARVVEHLAAARVHAEQRQLEVVPADLGIVVGGELHRRHSLWIVETGPVAEEEPEMARPRPVNPERVGVRGIDEGRVLRLLADLELRLPDQGRCAPPERGGEAERARETRFSARPANPRGDHDRPHTGRRSS